MWKYLLIGLGVFVLYKLFMNDRSRQSQNDTKQKERKIATGEMVKDPICGAYVEAEGSISVRDDKVLHRFCSYECRQKFLEKLEEEGRDVPKLSQKEED